MLVLPRKKGDINNFDLVTGQIFELISNKEIPELDKQKIIRDLIDLINQSFVIPHYFLQLKFALRRAWY